MMKTRITKGANRAEAVTMAVFRLILDEPTRSPVSLIKRVDSLCYAEYTAIIQSLTSNPLLVRSTLDAALSTFSVASMDWMSCCLA